MSGNMVDSILSTKYGINPCQGSRKMHIKDDGRPRQDNSSDILCSAKYKHEHAHKSHPGDVLLCPYSVVL